MMAHGKAPLSRYTCSGHCSFSMRRMLPSRTCLVLVATGFCAVSKVLPLPQTAEAETSTSAVMGNGINAPVNIRVHCIAAEPDATFLRLCVIDGKHEVAFESVVLGRLRHGYRVFQMRGWLGTRIELCFIFVRIAFGTEPNLWPT